MATVTASDVYDVPGAAVKIGVSESRLRRALRRRPDLDARCSRLAGRRLIGADLLDELAAEVRSATPDWAAGPK